MIDALESRNFLAHHFFLKRTEEFKTEQGRFALIGELLQIQEQLRRATNMIGGVRVALSEAINPTKPRSAEDALFSVEVEIPDDLV